MPRRIYTYGATPDGRLENLISTVGAFILGAGVLYDRQRPVEPAPRPRAGPDPWKANTLEWFTTSPPPPHNFDVIPRVRSVEPMRDIRQRIASQPARTACRERRHVC